MKAVAPPVRPGLPAWAEETGYVLILAVSTFLAYAPALGAGFIWDDNAHVTRTDLQNAHGLYRIWFERGATQQYYPILHSAFWFEHQLWGQSAPAYHLLNIVLHFAAAILFARLLIGLLSPQWPLPLRRAGAYLAAGIFALHPVGVESVAWVSEQKNTLSAVFYLAAAFCYLRFEERRRWTAYACSTACFVLALLSKSVTATLPAAWLVIAWWRRGRIDLRRDVVPLAPWLGLGAAAGLWTSWLERIEIGAQGPDFALSFMQRCALAGRIFWFYLGKLFWPAGLNFIYPKWTIAPGKLVPFVGLFGAIAVLALLVAGQKRSRAPLAAMLLFGGTLFPALGFFNVYPFIFSYVADHFQYLASLAVFAFGGVGLAWLAARYHVARSLQVIGALLLLSVLGVLTHAQAQLYHDSETLYRATLARNPRAWLAQLNLGGMLFERGDVAEAQTLLVSAETLQPDYPLTHFNLGQLYMRQGDLDHARREFTASLRLRPNDPEAHNNLGIVLARRGVAEQAAAEFQTAIRLRPNYPLAYCNWGILLMQQQRWTEARQQFEQALVLQPGMGEALSLLQRIPSP